MVLEAMTAGEVDSCSVIPQLLSASALAQVGSSLPAASFHGYLLQEPCLPQVSSGAAGKVLAQLGSDADMLALQSKSLDPKTVDAKRPDAKLPSMKSLDSKVLQTQQTVMPKSGDSLAASLQAINGKQLGKRETDQPRGDISGKSLQETDSPHPCDVANSEPISQFLSCLAPTRNDRSEQPSVVPASVVHSGDAKPVVGMKYASLAPGGKNHKERSRVDIAVPETDSIQQVCGTDFSSFALNISSVRLEAADRGRIATLVSEETPTEPTQTTQRVTPTRKDQTVSTGKLEITSPIGRVIDMGQSSAETVSSNLVTNCRSGTTPENYGSKSSTKDNLAAPIPQIVQSVSPAHSSGLSITETPSAAGLVADAKTVILPSANAMTPDMATTTGSSHLVHESLHAPNVMEASDLSSSRIRVADNAIEIGVSHGTHGWLRVRAEMQGETVVTSLSSPVPEIREMLHRDIPSMTAYLQEEKVNVGSLVVREMQTAGNIAGHGGGMQGQQASPQDQPKSQTASTRSDRFGEYDSAGFVSLPWIGESSDYSFAPAQFSGNGGWLSVHV